VLPPFDETGKLPQGIHQATWELLHPELLDFSDGRAAQKARYRGELFPAETLAEPAGTVFLDYFQRDRDTGLPKGIVAIDIGDRR